jgi:S-(hydroxymethyl)glutathione dehydrogenase/alcohol dehydrogenase
MGCSTMSEYTVLAEISCAVDKEALLEKCCLSGCGISTDCVVWKSICKVEVDSTVAVRIVAVETTVCSRSSRTLL